MCLTISSIERVICLRVSSLTLERIKNEVVISNSATAPDMPATAMINPQLLTHGKTIEKAWEGCLSVPSLRGLVPRYTDISISYFDLQGEKHYQQLTGFIARVFQHELDHLNGITFVDRVELTEDLMSEQEWYRQFVN